MTEPLRPLLLGIDWYTDNPGGLHRYLADLVAALRGAGTNARCVLLGPAADAPVGVLSAGDADAPVFRRLWSYWRAATRAGVDADLVDVHFAFLALGPVVVGRLRRLPLVVHFQGPWADESGVETRQRAAATLARRMVERAVYRRARQVVVLSSAFKRTIVEGYGVPPWRVKVVPPGVDLDRFRPGDRAAARRRLGVATDATVAVAVRRLVSRTGVSVLLDAWSRLPRGDSDVLLVVGGGPDRARLEAWADRLGVGASVRFLGVVDEETVVACYQAADVTVVPSVALEGFGLVVLEALACGTPVVATDIGGLPEALAPLEPRLVVPAGDADALAERVHQVVTGQGRWPDADSCRRYAAGFAWSSIAARHQGIYADAVHPRTGRVRVVYLDHCARLSGGELALLRLLPALTEVDAHVILAEEGPLVDRLVQAGVSVEVLPLAESARGLGREQVRPGHLPVSSAAHSAAYTARLAHRLRRLRPDLVHTNSLKAAVYGGMAGRLAGIPVVWHVRDRIADDYLPGPARFLVRAMARAVPAAIIANSESTLDTVARKGVPASVVASPVPVQLAPAGAGRRRAPGAPLRVGIVGRLAPWKGQTVFLEAFARAFPQGANEAVVVGAALFGEEAYEAELAQRATALGIERRVRFRGFREDVQAELATLDVLVHASTIPEPFGLVVVEGMAAGLPVVAAGAGGPVEVITEGVDGLLYPPGDVHALAAALRRLALDPGLRRRLGEAARRRAADFTPETVGQQVMDVYRGVLGGRANHQAGS